MTCRPYNVQCYSLCNCVILCWLSPS